MRLGTGVAAVACAAFGALQATAARATECTGSVNPCINDDTLWPHAGPSHFQSVGDSATVAPSHLGFGLVATYLSQPLTLHLTSPGGGSRDVVVHDQGDATFLWSYGVTRRLELDLALPLTLGQGGTGLAPESGGPGLRDTAVRDMRFGLAYQIVSKRVLRADSSDAAPATWGLAGRFEVSAPTGDRGQFGYERAAVYIPSFAVDGRVRRFFWAAEVGARIRPVAELLGARIGSQLLGALGLGVDLLPNERLAATLEAWALPTLAGQSSAEGNAGALVPAEWQLSLRTSPMPSHEVSVQLGGGGAIGDAVTTPQVRIVLSLRWAPGASVSASPLDSRP
jgi:hypothetical protein